MDAPDLEDASYSFRERFVMVVCQYQVFLYMALVLELMLLTLAGLSLVFADLDRASATVLFVDFVLLGGVMAATVAGLIVCNRR